MTCLDSNALITYFIIFHRCYRTLWKALLRYALSSNSTRFKVLFLNKSNLFIFFWIFAAFCLLENYLYSIVLPWKLLLWIQLHIWLSPLPSLLRHLLSFIWYIFERIFLLIIKQLQILNHRIPNGLIFILTNSPMHHTRVWPSLWRLTFIHIFHYPHIFQLLLYLHHFFSFLLQLQLQILFMTTLIQHVCIQVTLYIVNWL